MAALVLSGPLGPEDFEAFLAEQVDLSAKGWPRHVAILDELPRTATNKVLKRELTQRGAEIATWHRTQRGTTYQ